jgi:MFS family permease
MHASNALDDLRALGAYRGFTKLALARFISNLGNGITPIALSFGVLGLPNGSASQLSLVLGSQMIPLLLFMLFGGVIGDRYKRNKIVGGSDILGSAFVLVSASSFIFGFVSIPLLCAMGALFGVLNALWWPAFSGVLPEILPKEQLQRGNSVIGLLTNFGYTAGALVGGILVAFAGSGWALAVDAFSFFIAGVLVWSIDLPKIIRDESGTMFHQLVVGWREFIARKWVVSVVIAFTFINLAYESTIGVLGPLATKESGYGPREWSLVLAVSTVGMIITGLVLLKVRLTKPLVYGITPMLLMATWIFSITFSADIWIPIIVAFFAGVAIEIFYVAWSTSMQHNIPEEAYSRVVSYDALGSYALAPLGLIFIGPLAEQIGTKNALYILAALVFVAAIGALSVREVRQVRNEA